MARTRSIRKAATKTNRPDSGPLTLRSITIENFRGLAHLSLKGLRPVTVFTGDNGAGKTTVLEASLALWGRTTGQWLIALQSRRGLGKFRPEHGPPFRGLFNNYVDNGVAVFSTITSNDQTIRLEIHRTQTTSQVLSVDALKTAGIVQKIAGIKLRAYINEMLDNESELEYQFEPPNVVRMDWRGARSTNPPGLLIHPPDGSQSDIDTTRYADVKLAGDYEQVLNIVRAVDPRIVNVEFIEPTGHEYFNAVLKDGKNAPLGMLGGGVANVFRMALAMASVRNGFLAIDEVENGIYYRRLPKVFHGMLSARKRLGCVLFMATHSQETLNAIIEAASQVSPEDFAVVHLRRNEGSSVSATVVPGEEADSMRTSGYDLR